MAKPIKLYWDSCAWIGLLNGERDKKRELTLVYSHARDGKYEIWTSTLTMVECRRLSSEQYDPKPLGDENDRKIGEIFKQTFVKPIPLAMDIAEESRRIWRETVGLSKFQDAVHVASALRWNIQTMHTYDRDDLLHLSEKLKCRNEKPLVICYPDETTDGPLFGKAKSDGR